MSESADLVGSTVNGRYEVTKKLFSGFYGTCWKAHDVSVAQDVCIKTFFVENKDQLKELAILKEFVDGHFDHENLCQVLDVSLKKAPVLLAGHQPLAHIRYVSFEFCSGTDLFNFLITGPYERAGRALPFSEPLACHYFTQVLLAVMYLHERGVYHRDIKPENCVLDFHFNLKLTDFGTNKIIRQQETSEVLRTSTHNIGTDCYRAPELSGVGAYDPCYADVWSLGITLFFFTGIDVMVNRCKTLDPYMRRLIAPLGIYFPFPVQCSKLDSYLRDEEHIIYNKGFDGSLRGRPLRNELFWREWPELTARMSRDLVDLFNRIFILPPVLRITLVDMVAHSWVQQAPLSKDQVCQEMNSRLPKGVECSRQASPRVFSRICAGRDQASLRRSITRGYRVQFLPDGEVWEWSEGVSHLLQSQHHLLSTDIQQCLLSLGAAQSVVTRILHNPADKECRNLKRTEHWMQFLEALKFTSQLDGSLLLREEDVDKRLLHQSLDLLSGLEAALNSGTLFLYAPLSREVNEAEDMPTPTPSDPGALTTPTSDPYPARADSGHVALPECDEIMDRLEGLTELHLDSAHWPAGAPPTAPPTLCRLSAKLNRGTQGHYIAAHEFCKISGLLCSYGNLVQEVRDNILCTFCRGPASSFSVQVVVKDSEGSLAFVSSCFCGHDEWRQTITRLSQDVL